MREIFLQRGIFVDLADYVGARRICFRLAGASCYDGRIGICRILSRMKMFKLEDSRFQMVPRQKLSASYQLLEIKLTPIFYT